MVERREIYFKRDLYYDRQLQQLQDDQLPEQTKSAITRWQNSLFAKGSGKLRVAKLTSQIRYICKTLNKDLDQITVFDLESTLAIINQRLEWAENTRADYRRCMKQFFIWYYKQLDDLTKDQKKASEYTKDDIKARYTDVKRDFKDIITEEDIQVIIDKGCRTPIEKAFIAVLHESGFRIEEMLNMTVRSLEFKENQCNVTTNGKTGERTIPLYISIGHLTTWVNMHPLKRDLNACIWISNNCHKRNTPMKYLGAKKLVERVFARAGYIEYEMRRSNTKSQRLYPIVKSYKKKYNFHWFRHSRATLNSAFMKEAGMCKFFGWVQGSDQVRRYVHADISQVEEAISAARGLVKKEDNKMIANKCAICNAPNDKTADFCFKCGRPMTVKAAETHKAKSEKANKILEAIMKNPEFLAKFNNFNPEENGET